jgi:hypothetical protein
LPAPPPPFAGDQYIAEALARLVEMDGLVDTQGLSPGAGRQHAARMRDRAAAVAREHALSRLSPMQRRALWQLENGSELTGMTRPEARALAADGERQVAAQLKAFDAFLVEFVRVVRLNRVERRLHLADRAIAAGERLRGCATECEVINGAVERLKGHFDGLRQDFPGFAIAAPFGPLSSLAGFIRGFDRYHRGGLPITTAVAEATQAHALDRRQFAMSSIEKIQAPGALSPPEPNPEPSTAPAASPAVAPVDADPVASDAVPVESLPALVFEREPERRRRASRLIGDGAVS